jgi:hypothetical protein
LNGPLFTLTPNPNRQAQHYLTKPKVLTVG